MRRVDGVDGPQTAETAEKGKTYGRQADGIIGGYRAP